MAIQPREAISIQLQFLTTSKERSSRKPTAALQRLGDNRIVQQVVEERHAGFGPLQALVRPRELDGPNARTPVQQKEILLRQERLQIGTEVAVYRRHTKPFALPSS